MAEPLDTPLDANASSETALLSEPLGIQQPLLPPQTLGQTVPTLQFMVPLGAQPLAVLDPSIFFSEGGSEYAEVGQSFAESPFFDTSHSTVVDRKTESRRAELPPGAASGTLVQRQVAAPTSPAPLPSETRPIPVHEQAVEVLGTDSRESTGLPDATVDQPIFPHTDATNEFSSSEIAIASGVESSIQRSPEATPFTPTQPTVSDRSLPTQPNSTPAISSETQPIPESQLIGNPNEIQRRRRGDEETGTFHNVEATSPSQTQPTTYDRSSLETTLQPQLESSSKLEATSATSNSALVEAEAVTDTNAAAIESSVDYSRLVESSNETPTVQPATDSPVSERLTSTPVEQPTIPEPPRSSEPIGNEAIQAQRLPSEQNYVQSAPTQSLPLQQAEDNSSGQPESSTISSDILPGSSDVLPGRTESSSENSPRPAVSPFPSPLEPPPQSPTPVVQTYPASDAAIQLEQVATPQSPEVSAAALQTNSPTDLQAESSVVPSTPNSLERDALTPPSTPIPIADTSELNLLQRELVEENLTTPSHPSTPSLLERTVKPAGVEPIEDIAIASSEPTLSLHPEQVQARFEPAVSQPEPAASPLLDLSTESGELSSSETPQPVTESVRENPATSPTSLFTPPEVTVQRSHSPSELPLPALEQTTNAEAGTPTPDSVQPIQEPIPSAPTQNTSPQALTPTIQTEATLQPQLDSASLSTTTATSSSAFDPGSLLGKSEAEATAPQNELKVETEVQHQSSGDDIQTQELSQIAPESVTDNSEATEPAPALQQRSSVSPPTPIQSETSVQEPSQNAIATDSTSLPSASAQPLESQVITTSTEEETTPTPETTIQPVSESTTIQRQVTEVPTLSEPESNRQSLNDSVAGSIEATETTPTLQQSSSVSESIPVQSEASVQELSQNAIASVTDLLPDASPISPSTTQESSPGVPSTFPTDSLTSTEPELNLIQPFQQPDTSNVVAQPELPTVLQNLTVLNSLGSTPLIQTAAIEDTTPLSEPPPVRVERRELPSPVFSSSSISAQSVSQTASTASNQEAVTSVPDEWSSIAELLNRSSSPASHSSSSVNSPFPEVQPFGATETVIQAQFEPVMRQISANSAPPSQSDEQHSQVTEVKADIEDIPAPSPEQLEKLAREIYGLVRQRLQIEQERSGNSYLGRLPW